MPTALFTLAMWQVCWLAMCWPVITGQREIGFVMCREATATAHRWRSGPKGRASLPGRSATAFTRSSAGAFSGWGLAMTCIRRPRQRNISGLYRNFMKNCMGALMCMKRRFPRPIVKDAKVFWRTGL